MAQKPKTIYYGPRDQRFRSCLSNALGKGNLDARTVDFLLQPKHLDIYGRAFTALTADYENNYERFEHLGDDSINKFVRWYMFLRFPQLDCTQGVGVLSRLYINYKANIFLANIAKDLGFWDFISAAESHFTGESGKETKLYSRNNYYELLGDCFEAFIGCTEYIMDLYYPVGVGYGIVYAILKGIYDKLEVSLDYRSCKDPKTRLQEFFPQQKKEGYTIGTYRYVSKTKFIQEEGKTVQVHEASVLWYFPALIVEGAELPNKNASKLDAMKAAYAELTGQPLVVAKSYIESQFQNALNASGQFAAYDIEFSERKQQGTPVFKAKLYLVEEVLKIGVGEHRLKSEAEKIAAEAALDHLERLGYEQKIPEFYQTFCQPAAAAATN